LKYPVFEPVSSWFVLALAKEGSSGIHLNTIAAVKAIIPTMPAHIGTSQALLPTRNIAAATTNIRLCGQTDLKLLALATIRYRTKMKKGKATKLR
jgi:hypothetical protein